MTPDVEAVWRRLFEHVSRDAGVAFDYLPYPAPQPLEPLWQRPDLGCVFMCGFPIALALADVVPVAAPIPDAPWARGRALYRSDLVVRAESPLASLEETFGGTVGWTVEHSHSGFNALRHHLLQHRRGDQDRLFQRSVGSLLTARKILESVLDGTIDVGPLDGYWHLLAQRHLPDLASGVRVIASTDLAPIPALVASAGMPRDEVARLQQSFVVAVNRPWFPALSETLCLRGFEAVDQASFGETLRWAREAEAAGYAIPA